MSTPTTAIDRLHATPGHVQSTLGCPDCRTFARVLLGYWPDDHQNPGYRCDVCKAPFLPVWRDVKRLGDYVDTRA